MEIAIIGGGASGMAAALNACNRANVTIYERQPRLGRKLLATGNGRCNLTNQDAGIKNYYGQDTYFINEVFAHFPPEKIMDMFAYLGVETILEDHGRIFPRAEQAAVVLDNLRLFLLARNVKEVCECEITQIIPQKQGFILYNNKKEHFYADKVIIAAGSMAAPHLGGTDKGYQLLQSLGHTLLPVSEAIVQLKCNSPVLKALSGQKFIGTATLLVNDKAIRKENGEILFTDYGLSGLPILQLSTMAIEKLNRGQKVAISLDLAYEYFSKEFLAYLYRRRIGRGQIPLEDFFTGFCAKRIGQQLLKSTLDTPLSRLAITLNDKELEKIAHQAKNWVFPVIGSMGMKNAQAALGGISLKDFSAETLESKIVPGLYACGEVLDITGDCGGFNLQWAWASGLLAGMNAVCS